MTHRTNHGELGCNFSHMGHVDPYVGGVEFDFFVTREGKEYQFICRKSDVLKQIECLTNRQEFTVFYTLNQDPEGETYLMCKYIMTGDSLQQTLDI